jgi:DNA-binding NarL/FixJ family response regulator
VKPITVLLVDDHRLLREGVRSILQRAADRFEIIGEADNGAQAQVLALKLKPDIVLMDVQMPTCSGLAAARALAPQLPDTKIVMLTVSDRDEDLFAAVKAGAKGYILKVSTSADEMVTALERVAAGEVILTPVMAVKLVAEFAMLAHERERIESPAPSSTAGDPRLTDREHQVLEFVAAGKTNKEIAATLNIAENTVRAHLRNILDKLHVQNRTQAAIYARREH